MPSVLHEALRELFAQHPAEVLSLLGDRVRLPVRELVAVDSELTEPRVKQLLPDVLLAGPSGDAPRVVVVVEVQLAIVEAKRRVWPQYVAAKQPRRLSSL
jgi:hypothetical protein